MATASTLSFSSTSNKTTTTGTFGKALNLYARRSGSTSGYTYSYKVTWNNGADTTWIAGAETTGVSATSQKFTPNSTMYGWITPYTPPTIPTSRELVFTLYTFYHGDYVGQTSATATVSLPTLNNPVVLAYSFDNGTGSDKAFIQGMSSIRFHVDLYIYNTSKTPNGAYVTIANYTSKRPLGTMHSYGDGFYSLSFESDTLYYSGNNIVAKFYVIDDRNYQSNQYSVTIDVTPYSAPQITKYGASRYSLVNGTLVPDDSGQYAKFYFTGAVENIQQNTGTFEIEYMNMVTSDGGSVTLSEGTRTYSVSESAPQVISDPPNSTNPDDFIVLNPDYSWIIGFRVTDTFTGSGSYQSMTLSVGTTTMDFLAGGKGVAVGKVAETENLFDVAFDTRLRGDTQIDADLTVNGVVTLGNPLSVANGGTGSRSSLFESGDLVQYISSDIDGEYFTTMDSTNAKSWLNLGDLSEWDSEDLSTYLNNHNYALKSDIPDVTGFARKSELGDLAYKDTISARTYVTGLGNLAYSDIDDLGTFAQTSGSSGFISDRDIAGSSGIPPLTTMTGYVHVSGFTSSSLVFFTLAGSFTENVVVRCTNRLSGQFNYSVTNYSDTTVHPSLYYLCVF